MITIVSKKDGFRRCGIAHSQAPVEYADDRFTAEDILALQAEPTLVVTLQKSKVAKDKGGKEEGGK